MFIMEIMRKILQQSMEKLAKDINLELTEKERQIALGHRRRSAVP